MHFGYVFSSNPSNFTEEENIYPILERGSAILLLLLLLLRHAQATPHGF